METMERSSSSLKLLLGAESSESPPVSRFFPLLQQGFTVLARLGCTIRELLCGQFGLDPDYLEQRITTIFLNGKAIDDPGSSRVGPGATLALSAAMPGLVGATMRAGGYYAAMRGAMTHNESIEEGRDEYGRVRIKLFNLLMGEMGPGFLSGGIFVTGEDLVDFLAGQPEGFPQACRRALIDGKPVDPGSLEAGFWEGRAEESVHLIVSFEE